MQCLNATALQIVNMLTVYLTLILVILVQNLDRIFFQGPLNLMTRNAKRDSF